jgi:hypothetical protein
VAVDGDWDADMMIVSLLYRAARTLLSIPRVLLRRDTAKDAELLVLQRENTVLRRQLKTRPLRTCGPILVHCPVPTDSAPPPGEHLPHHARHPSGLAPQTDRQSVGLLRAPTPHRSTTDSGRAQEAGAALGERESAVGPPPDPG